MAFDKPVNGMDTAVAPAALAAAVTHFRIRWLAVLSVLAIVVVLSACSDSPAPTPEPTATPTAAPTAMPTPEPTPTSIPVRAPTATPISVLTPTRIPPIEPTPAPSVTFAPTPTVKLVLDAYATVAGYWPDGTADVELTVSLRNEGDLKFDDTQSITVTCHHNAGIVDGCGGELRVSLHDGYGPVSETLHLRVPMGEMSFRLHDGNGEPLTILLDVPERILGVDRDVWKCFSDTSNRGGYREFGEGIGCAAWASEKLVKWDQGRPLQVWATGIDSWIEVFKGVMVDLGRLMNLDFEWVATGSEPEEGIIAHIGVPYVVGGDTDETCPLGSCGLRQREDPQRVGDIQG